MIAMGIGLWHDAHCRILGHGEGMGWDGSDLFSISGKGFDLLGAGRDASPWLFLTQKMGIFWLLRELLAGECGEFGDLGKCALALS